MFALKILDISDNKISELPRNLGKFSNLRQLNVSKNNLQSVDCIFQADYLEVIDMSKNKICSLGSFNQKMDVLIN